MAKNDEAPNQTSKSRGRSSLEQYLLQNLSADKENVEGIANSIKDGHARIVSDGSYYEGTGVATFVVRIESADKQYSLDTEQYVPGVLAENDAYRAEATGILAGLCICWAICKYKDITGGNVKIRCDGESALNMAMHEQWDVRTSDKHYDIIDMIHCRKKTISQTMTKHWIRGHQDTNRPFRLLDRMTQMNILCDQAALEMGAREVHPPIPSEVHSKMWEIHIGGSRVINKMERRLRERIHDPDLEERWTQNQVMTAKAQQKIDWEAVRAAAKSARQ